MAATPPDPRPADAGDAGDHGVRGTERYDDRPDAPFASSGEEGEIDPIVDEEEYGAPLEEVPEEMGFFDHLEELRWRIIKALIGLAIAGVFCGIYYREIVTDVLLRPADIAGLPLINTMPMGQLSLAIGVVLMSAVIVSIPWIIWQFWGFIKPGLYPKERKYVSSIAIATIFCFLAGVLFAYYVMIPSSLTMMSGFELGRIKNQIASTEYFSFVIGFVLACGVVFEMPMLSYALSRFGIVTPGMLRKYRRHSVVVIMIAASIVTPTPDPWNMMLLAVPLYVLFEISILVSAAANRARRETLEEEGLA